MKKNAAHNWEHKRWQGQEGADLFEKLCADLLRSLGFKKVDWRKGHPDEGWDAEAVCEVFHPAGKREETWYVQCKRYSINTGVPPTKIDTKRIEMLAKKPDCLLVITNSYFLPKVKDWVTSAHPFRIELWEGDTLAELVPRFAPLMEEYFPELAIRLKDEFVLVLVHMLRSSLQWLLSQIAYTQMLVLDSDQKNQGKVEDGFRRLHELVGNLNTQIERFNLISRSDFQSITGDRKPLDLMSVIGKTVEGLNILARRENVRMNLRGPKHLLIEGDERSLTIMINDLLDNALKYSFANRIVEIECSNDLTQAFVRIVISNVGVGIPPEDMGKVFQKYYRGYRRDARRFVPGTGIGLTLVRRIAEEYGGSVSLESHEMVMERNGAAQPWLTRCTVRLPIRKGLSHE